MAKIVLDDNYIKSLPITTNRIEVSWDKDKFGKKLNAPIDSFNHLMDAMRYGLESDIIGCPAAGINRNTDLRGGF